MGVGDEVARVSCVFGKRCKFGLEGTCRYVHSAADEAHFEVKRAVLAAEQGEECPFWRLGRCRWGEACRWRHGDSWGSTGASELGDSDYDASDPSDGEAVSGDEGFFVWAVRDSFVLGSCCGSGGGSWHGS